MSNFDITLSGPPRAGRDGDPAAFGRRQTRRPVLTRRPIHGRLSSIAAWVGDTNRNFA